MLALRPCLAPSLRLAQALGIVTSAFLSGGILAVSYRFVSLPNQAPSGLLVCEWQNTQRGNGAASRSLAIISSLSYIYLSYNLSFTLNQHKAEVYAFAALAISSIVPYNWIFIKAVNKKLDHNVEDLKASDRSQETDESMKKKEECLRELLDRWAWSNVGRGLLPFTGACLGIYASFYMIS